MDTDKSKNPKMAGPSRYSLVWTNTKSWKHDKEMAQKVRDFQEEDVLCDLTLSAGGASLQVHKVIMATASDYFKVMLTSNMLESRQRVIELKALTSIGLKAIVEFAYHGTATLTPENIADVLSAASHCLMMELVSRCGAYMATVPLTCDNCVNLMNLSNMYSVKPVIHSTVKFFFKNFKEIYEKKLFFQLSADNLVTILTECPTGIESPFELDWFKLVTEWVNFSNEREEYLSKVMLNIRFPLMPPSEIDSNEVSDVIQKCSKEVKRSVLEAKKYHRQVEQQPQLQMKNKTDYELRSAVPTLVTCNGTQIRYIDITSGETGCLRDIPCALFDASICSVNNFLYVCGGTLEMDEISDQPSSVITSKCFWYNPRLDIWCEMKSMKQPRTHFALVPYNDGFYAIGGSGKDGEPISSVENFSIMKNRWCPGTHLPFPLQRHTGRELLGKLYVSGGSRPDCASSATLLCLDTSQKSTTWVQKARMLYDRRDHSMVAMSGKLYVVGGIKTYECNKDGPNPCIEDCQQIECYDPEADQWTICKKLTPPSLTSVAATVCQGHLFTLGNVKTVIPEIWWTYIRKIEPLNGIGATAIHECFIYRGSDIGDERLRDISRHNCALLELPQNMHGRRVAATEPYIVKRKRDRWRQWRDYNYFTAPENSEHLPPMSLE